MIRHERLVDIDKLHLAAAVAATAGTNKPSSRYNIIITTRCTNKNKLSVFSNENNYLFT